MPSVTAPIAISKVSNRRVLRFTTIDDVQAEVDRLSLAGWASFPFDRFPANLRIPWIARVIVKQFKNRFLNGSMSAGRRIPGIKDGTRATDPLSLDEGLARFKQAFSRLK